MSNLFRDPSARTSLAAALALLATVVFTPGAYAGDPGGADGKTTIVFVCLHGSVKSQMAAAHFNRIASERGLPFTAISRGIEVDTSIPTRIRDGLNLDGLAPTDDIPIGLTADEAGRATKVVAFDTVPEARRGTSEVTYWSDVPPATKDYAAARDVIVRHIDTLVPTLVSTAPASETLRGVVASVDERNDSISVRLQSPSKGDTTEDFRVQDGLIFNAVRFGDSIAFTVETIRGAKTITRPTKE
jgi:protein-tyrosine-phosphatase